MADISDLPVPTEQDMKQLAQPGISDLPAPPPAPVAQAAAAPGISDLPVPTAQESAVARGISDLPVPGAPQATGTAGSVDKELENRSFFNRPGFRAEETKPDEISQIAAKHGVDPAQLQQLAPYFGARLQGKEAQEAAGYAGEVALGVPQKLYKMSQTPAMEKALDDVQALASGRESYLGLAGQVAAPVIPGVGAAASLGAKITHGAAIGGVAGAAGSRRGQEIEGAGFGAALGGTIGLVAGKLSRQTGTAAEKAVAQDVVRSSAPHIEQGVEDILDKQSGSLPDIEAHVLSGEAGAVDLEPQIVSKIVQDHVDPEILEGKLDMSTPEGRLMRQRAEEELPEVVRDRGAKVAVEQVIAQDVIDKKASDFAEYLSGEIPKTREEADEAIQYYAHAQGGDQALKDRWNNFLKEEAGQQYVTDTHLRPGRENNFVNKALNFVSGSQFVLRDIDNRTGVGAEAVQREISRQLNRMSYARQEFRGSLDSIFREARSSGVDQAVTGSDKLYNAIDTGNFGSLSPQEVQVAQRFKGYFQKGLDYVNSVSKEDPELTPLSIPKKENYVPYQLKPVRELESDIQAKIATTGADLSQVADKRAFTELVMSYPELQQVVEGLNRLDRRAAPQTGPELLSRVHDLFQTREGRTALETVAKAALERSENSVPQWMRQTDLYKLADNWATSTLRHLYLRDPIEKLAGKMRTLRRAGAELEAGYLQTLLTDLQGVRQGTAAAYTSSVGDRWSKLIDRAMGGSENPAVQAAGGVAKALPSMLGDINRQIYPNMLGLNPRAIIMNATQPVAKTLPEIGLTPYGAYSLARGTVSALMNFSEQKAKVLSQGLQPAEFIGKFRRAVTDGIQRSSLYAIPQETLQQLGQISMSLYEKMDILNRSITLSTAESIARDISAGSKAAQGVIGRMPSAVQRDLARAGSEEEMARVLASHLNASTQYNYNRASMSEFGRTMGTFFSTFTKWPTETAGELLLEWRDKGLTKGTLRNMEKFIAPYLLFKGVDSAIKGVYGDHGEFTDRQKQLLGQGGLAGSSPIGSIQSVAQGKLFAPPAVDAILKGIVEPIRTQDPSKVKNAAISALQEFAPGAVYVRFLTDDLVTYITGHRPEGKNFIERTENGAKELNKVSK